MFRIDQLEIEGQKGFQLFLVDFDSIPELYKRVRIDMIQIKKSQPELFKSRLSKFIENTRKGIIYGEWNDNGRL